MVGVKRGRRSEDGIKLGPGSLGICFFCKMGMGKWLKSGQVTLRSGLLCEMGEMIDRWRQCCCCGGGSGGGVIVV